jgi:DNA-binding NtrC family response regulator
MKKNKILLIDQHHEWLEFAQDVLNDEYEVTTISNYKDISLLQEKTNSINGFDLIFIGLELATNNLAALKPLFKKWQFVVVFPIIQENDTVRMLFKAGVYDCAPKPYEREGLLKLVADELIEAKMANDKTIFSPQEREKYEKQFANLFKLEDKNGTQ